MSERLYNGHLNHIIHISIKIRKDASYRYLYTCNINGDNWILKIRHNYVNHIEFFIVLNAFIYFFFSWLTLL